MAFPTVDATATGTQASNSTSWSCDITALGTISSGDLLLFFAGMDGSSSSPTLDEDDGGGLRAWTVKCSNANGYNEGSCGLVAFARVATGAEGTTLNFRPGASEQGAWRAVRISASSWYGALLGGLDQSAVPATGSSTTPNPAAAAPGWGALDILWIAACGVDGARDVTGWPFATAQFSDNSGGGAGASLGTCREENAVASNDPGDFTIAASDGWAAVVFAVRPASALGDDEQIAARTVKPDRVRSLTGASRAGSGMTPACYEQGEVLQA